MNEMDRAHREDMETEFEIIDVLGGMRRLREKFHGRKAGNVLEEAIKHLEAERAAIVRRWD